MSKAAQARIRAKGPATLTDIVRELVVEFRAKDDRPADHRCATPTGYRGPQQLDRSLVCTHATHSSRSLLDRLASLVAPGAGPAREDPGKRSKSSTGSPAPWSAEPAELLDEILLGAIDLAVIVRQLLGFAPLPVTLVRVPADPAWHPPLAYRPLTLPVHRAPRALAGRAALMDLPVTLPLLQERYPHLGKANGALLDPARPAKGHRWGEVESKVRFWHREAQLLTGHQVEAPRVREMHNPVFGERRPGPTCDGPYECGHTSCRRIAMGHEREWLRPHCPYCGASGLPQDQKTGAIYCDRSTCRDDRGRRHEWSVDAFRHFGLVLLEVPGKVTA